MRTQAATAIGESNSPSALAILIELLHDPSYWVRQAAASYLAIMTDTYPGEYGIFGGEKIQVEFFPFRSTLLKRRKGVLESIQSEATPDPLFCGLANALKRASAVGRASARRSSACNSDLVVQVFEEFLK